jgi:hypothetical protein
MDVGYQQDSWATMDDSISSAYRMMKSKPTEAVIMAAATAAAVSQFAYKAVAASRAMKSINTINN